MQTSHNPKDRINDFLEFQQSAFGLKEIIIKLGRVYKIPSARIKFALIKIDDAFAVVNGKKASNQEPRKLKKHEINRIVELIDSMDETGRMFFMLLKKEDGTGLMDPVSGKTFEYDQN